MEIPPRDALIDIEWLERTHAAHGMAVLGPMLRRGSEVYGGAVTAIADAALSPPAPTRGLPWTDRSEVRYALAHKLLAGCWSPAQGGPRRYRQEHPEYVAASVSREFRARVWESQRATRGIEPAPEPTLPTLADLRLPDVLAWASLAHTKGIWGCEVSPDGTLVASVSRDGSIALWDVTSGLLVARVHTRESDRPRHEVLSAEQLREVRHCGFTPDGRRLIAWHTDGRVTVWRVPGMTALFEIPARMSWPPYRWRQFAISPDSAWLAVANGRSAVDLWDLEQQRHVDTVVLDPEHSVRVCALAFISERQLRVVGHERSSILTVDVMARHIVTTQPWPRKEVYDRILLTADGRYLVAKTWNTKIDVWELEPPRLVASVPVNVSGQALALSADGTRGASYSFDPGGLQVWSLPNLQEIGRCDLQYLGAWDVSCTLAFTHDGRSIIAAGWDGVLRRVELSKLSAAAAHEHP